MKNSILLMALFILNGCFSKYTINNKPHIFDKEPRKIVWLQIAGLAESHFLYLKLVNGKASFKTAIEDSTCVGQTWNYNFRTLRPNARTSFLSQTTFTKKMANNCSDYMNPPFWDKINELDFKIGMLEANPNKKCFQEKKKYYKNIVRWEMAEAKNKEETFHLDIKKDYKVGSKYLDLGCKNKRCYSSLESNAESLFKQYFEDSTNYIFLIKDFSLLKILKKKNYKYLSERLAELNYLISFFYKKAEKDGDMLVMVSAAESVPIELPSQGAKYWKNAANTFKYSSFKKPSLMSPFLAKGAGAERFCGIFDATDIIKKLY